MDNPDSAAALKVLSAIKNLTIIPISGLVIYIWKEHLKQDKEKIKHQDKLEEETNKRLESIRKEIYAYVGNHGKDIKEFVKELKEENSTRHKEITLLVKESSREFDAKFGKIFDQLNSNTGRIIRLEEQMKKEGKNE